MRFEVYSNGRSGERERGKDPSPQHSGVEVRVWCRHHGVKTKVRRPKRMNSYCRSGSLSPRAARPVHQGLMSSPLESARGVGKGGRTLTDKTGRKHFEFVYDVILSNGVAFRNNYRSYFERYKTERGATKGLIASATRDAKNFHGLESVVRVHRVRELTKPVFDRLLHPSANSCAAHRTSSSTQTRDRIEFAGSTRIC